MAEVLNFTKNDDHTINEPCPYLEKDCDIIDRVKIGSNTCQDCNYNAYTNRVERIVHCKYQDYYHEADVQPIAYDDFQATINQLIQRVGSYPAKNHNEKLSLNSLAMAGEAGEIANKIKKHTWYAPQQFEVLRTDLKEELGDVMYHVAQLATELKLNMSDILESCVEKSKNTDKQRWAIDELLKDQGEERG